ncbi:hypothetical protein GWK48_02585 [Metallosphaera tengchongensis]|uniref:DUF4352 domain-containing protein n=1 Tax=Metallosphaera tengchongensis TaxID=1532350 RepID=A0A6N0NSB1_9CREN|nr:hypothetical protein [Metallosphaera tengchongensis]QKQ98986.1 hypothetical protein GWK48_02585 [Metallosphaera tengchongensis]
MRRYLKSKRAISGAVTALILVIVSVALALAVAVFAFGLFGTFGSSGQVQAIGTPVVNVYSVNNKAGVGVAEVSVSLNLKNSGTNAASITSITVGDLTNSSGFKVIPATIPGGYDGQVTVLFNVTPSQLPGTLNTTNIGGSVPITIVLSEGSLSPTLTLQGVLNSTKF